MDISREGVDLICGGPLALSILEASPKVVSLRARTATMSASYRSPYNLRSTGDTISLADDSPNVDTGAVQSFLNDVSPLTIAGANATLRG